MSLNDLTSMFDGVFDLIRTMTIPDVIDILCVSVLFYFIYKFIRQRQAGKLAIGLVLLFVIQLITEAYGMYVMQFILQNLFQVGIITIVILFQPEIRTVLEKFGSTPVKGIKSLSEKNNSATIKMINQVADALSDLSESKTGALMVFERETKLQDIVPTGTVINADPASFLIKNIFFNKAPMHDGAVLVRANRIYAAGCILPLSTNPDIIKDLGTRHRAAIGMSEQSDALVVVVSEETGSISVAFDGKLKRNLTKEMLIQVMEHYLLEGRGSTKKLHVSEKSVDSKNSEIGG